MNRRVFVALLLLRSSALYIFRTVTTAFLAISSQPAFSDQLDICQALLSDGVFDTRQTQSAWDNYQRVSSVYCSDEASTYSKAKSLKISGIVLIDDVLVSLGFGQSDNEYNSFRKQLCYSNDQIYSRKGWLDDRISKASSVILETFRRCVESLRDGFFMQVFDLDREGSDFTWEFINKVPSDEKIHIKVTIPKNISCKNENNAPIKPGQEFAVGHAGLRFTCTRSDCTSGVLSVGKTTHGITPSSIRLPAYNNPPAPPEPIPHYETSMWHPMNAPWSTPIPNTEPDESCSVVSFEGTWSCHYDSCPRDCNPAIAGPSPFPIVSGNIESSGQFERPDEYRDNTGNCRYTFKCTKPILVGPAPALPKYCQNK